MKRLLFAFIFVFLVGLFSIPQINPTSAATCPDGSNGIADGGLCHVSSPSLCCSKSCVWNRNMLTPGFGQCKQPTQTSPCITRDAEGRCQEINTAFGVIKTSPEGFIEILFGVLLAASGAIAVLLLMRAGYQIMTARGNPEGIKEGREKIVAVILGLMFLVFSVVFLEVIGVDLLRIPGFSR